MNIITLTLNPAIDVHLRADVLTPSGYNTARFLRRDSGGKGINVSRALGAWGVDSLCYAVIGEDNAEEFAAPVAREGINIVYSTVKGRVRENINIQHPESETVIAMQGPSLDKLAVERAERDLSAHVNRDTVLCFSGSLSEGTDKDAVLSLLYRMKSLGARLVIDTRSLSIEEIISLRPYLIKPNEAEAFALTGMSADGMERAAEIAIALRDMGCENVLLTLGEGGAALASADGVFVADAPDITPVSTVGAGDSTIAGFLSSRTSGADALALSVAFGSAACLSEGTSPPDPCQIKRLLAEIRVKQYM